MKIKSFVSSIQSLEIYTDSNVGNILQVEFKKEDEKK